MNLLTLCQALVREGGISGTFSTVVGVTGEFARVLAWIQDNWTQIQTKHDDWTWMRSSNVLGVGASFATLAGQASYPLGSGAGTVGVTAANFGKWDEESFRVQTTSVGFLDETFLDPVTYDTWRNVYMYGANRSVQTRPVAVAIGPSQNVCLGPPPNALYTVTADYFLAPSQMTADANEPTGLPAQFHMAIVYKALMDYGAYESAPEVYQRGEMKYKQLLAQLEAQRGQKVAFAGALC